MKRVFKPLIKLSFLVIFVLLVAFSSDAGVLKRPFSFQHVTPKEGLSSEMVFAIAIQGEELWFGTYSGGATLYDPSKKTCRAYTTKGEPMDKVDKGVSINWQNLLPYNHVSVILADVDRVWFGTYFYGFGGGGISYYHPGKNPPWKKFTTNDGRAKKVNSMALDGDSVWVGSEKGLSLFDKKTEGWKRFYSTEDGLSGNFVNSLLAQSNFIWAGGLGGTLFEYDGASDLWRKIEPTDSLKSGGLHSIAVGKEKAFVCRDNGVSLYDLPTKQWEALTVADGLLSNTVFCAVEDQNSIWFGTDKGVSRLLLMQ